VFDLCVQVIRESGKKLASARRKRMEKAFGLEVLRSANAAAHSAVLRLLTFAEQIASQFFKSAFRISPRQT